MLPYTNVNETDHKGVVLPPDIILKPLRYKVQLRGCREHRKAAFYYELDIVNWSDILADHIEDAVTRLETKNSPSDRCLHASKNN